MKRIFGLFKMFRRDIVVMLLAVFHKDTPKKVRGLMLMAAEQRRQGVLCHPPWGGGCPGGLWRGDSVAGTCDLGNLYTVL